MLIFHSASSTGRCAHPREAMQCLLYENHDCSQWADLISSGHIVRSVIIRKWIMTDSDVLQSIKIIAKRIARTKRIPHHAALNLVANDLAHPHWRALTVAWEKGWRPNPVEVDTLRKNLTADGRSALPPASAARAVNDEIAGSIDGHPYSISLDFEVLMQGRGWAILVGQAPSEPPQIERTDRRTKTIPITSPEFIEKASAIANSAAEQLRARIAADWPRRSTKPDAKGRATSLVFRRSE